MKRSLSAISTVNASFAEDVAAYAAAGFDAIGLWEMKLPEDDAANIALIRSHGLDGLQLRPDRAVVPAAGDPRDGRPAGHRRRGSRRSAPRSDGSRPTSRSASSASAARSAGAPTPRAARSSSTACAARQRRRREAGVRLGFEPVHPAQRDTAGFVTSLGAALALLDEAGATDVGIMADTFNLGARGDGRDRRRPPDGSRGSTSRTSCRSPFPASARLPERGGRSAELIAALRDAGWDGTLDVEIFSTPDAFWALPAGRGGAQGVRARRRRCPEPHGRRPARTTRRRSGTSATRPGASAGFTRAPRAGASRTTSGRYARGDADPARARAGASAPVRGRGPDARRRRGALSAATTTAAASASCSSAGGSRTPPGAPGRGSRVVPRRVGARARGGRGRPRGRRRAHARDRRAARRCPGVERARDGARALVERPRRAPLGRRRSRTTWPGRGTTPATTRRRSSSSGSPSRNASARTTRSGRGSPGGASPGACARSAVPRRRSRSSDRSPPSSRRVGETDGYVTEEIAECLLALGRDDEARPLFARAYAELSRGRRASGRASRSASSASARSARPERRRSGGSRSC